MKPQLLSLLLAFLVLSCGQYNGNEEKAFAAATDSVSVTGFTGDSAKLVKSAALRFKVDNVEHSTRAVSSVAQQLGGMIYNEAFDNAEGERHELKVSDDSLLVVTTTTPQSEITARVPSENLEVFLNRVADLGYFTSSATIRIDDKSLEYLENALKQKNRKEVLSKPLPAKKTPSSLQTIEVKDEITEQQIHNRAIDADVHYSTVNLSLFQNPLVRREVIANYAISDYQLPFARRLVIALADGWSSFLSFILALLHLWMFILLGIAVYLSYRYLNQKRKQAASF